MTVAELIEQLADLPPWEVVGVAVNTPDGLIHRTVTDVFVHRPAATVWIEGQPFN
jgi:hypothetical protein